MGARHTRELEDLSPVTSPPWSLFSLREGGDVRIRRRKGKDRRGP